VKVRVMQRIGSAINARRLSKPHPKHTVELGSGHVMDQLGSINRRGGEFFVQTELVIYAPRLEYRSIPHDL
jgi:hypothetical protein